MSPTEPIVRFIFALIKGMDGPDLEKLFTDYPAFLGEETGKILKRIVAGGGTISRKDEDALKASLVTPGSKPAELLAALLKQLLTSDLNSSRSVTVHYLRVLNTIIEVLGAIGNPIVLAGFLHTPECLSYWDFEPGTTLEKLALESDTTVIHPIGRAPRIYILPGDGSDDAVRGRNLQIRMNSPRRLDVKAVELQVARYVAEVAEFTIRLEGLTGKENPHIPLGAPGILRMFASLPLAIAAQERPMKDIERTLRQVQGSPSSERGRDPSPNQLLQRTRKARS